VVSLPQPTRWYGGASWEPRPKTNLVHSRVVRKPLVAIILNTLKCMFLLQKNAVTNSKIPWQFPHTSQSKQKSHITFTLLWGLYTKSLGCKVLKNVMCDKMLLILCGVNFTQHKINSVLCHTWHFIKAHCLMTCEYLSACYSLNSLETADLDQNLAFAILMLLAYDVITICYHRM